MSSSSTLHGLDNDHVDTFQQPIHIHFDGGSTGKYELPIIPPASKQHGSRPSTLLTPNSSLFYRSFLTSPPIEDDGSLIFEARSPKKTLSKGHYRIVFYVPKYSDGILLDELTIEIRVTSTKIHRATSDCGYSKNFTSDATAKSLLGSPEGSALVLLTWRQYRQSQNHRITIKVRLFPIDEMYYEVKAPGELLQRIPMTQIIAIDVSASGAYVAILSVHQLRAYVDVWEIEAILRPTATRPTEHHSHHSFSRSNPMASTSFAIQDGGFEIMRLARIAVSSDGLCVVLYQEPCDDNLVPVNSSSELPRFLFSLKAKETYVTAKDYQDTVCIQAMEMVEDITARSSMDQFIGYGKFMSNAAFGRSNGKEDNGGSKGDYFVACDQSRIVVYDVDHGWKPLYGIAIGGLYSMKSRMNQLRILHQSLQGPAFVWMEDFQNVSIWDVVSGTNVRYISVHDTDRQSQDEIEYIAVSPGGRLMALAGKDWIRTYFMESGIEISSKVIEEGNILNIEFLGQDHALVVAIEKPSMEQISMTMDAMNLTSWNSPPMAFHSSSFSIQHVVRPSGKTMKGQKIGGVMMAVNHNVLEMFAIPPPGVLIPGGPLIGCKEDCATTKHQELKRRVYQQPGSDSQYHLVTDFEERKVGNRQHKVTRVRLYSVNERGQERNVITIVPEPWKQSDVDDEESASVYVIASFIDSWPQFIVITSLGFQVWNLPYISPDNRCEMVLYWVRPCAEDAIINGMMCNDVKSILGTRVCAHGECVRTSLGSSECIRIPKTNWITRTETLYCINSLSVLNSCYKGSSTETKEAIVRYIVKHINHDPPEGTIDDVMMTIAQSIRTWNYSDIFDAILRSTDGKWIPRSSSINSRRPGTKAPTNPIMLLVMNAKKVPHSLGMAEKMMDYCIRQAKSQCDPAFVLPVLSCLHLLAIGHPEIAIDITRRMAFIPVKNQDFVVNNSILARPFWRPVWDRIMRRSGAIYDYPSPAFQLRSQLPRISSSDISTHIEIPQELIVDPMNKTLKGPIYVVPYSLLWHYTDEDATARSIDDVSVQPNPMKAITTVIRTTLNPWEGRTVRANFSDLSYFENPAVGALVKYKWDSVAWKTWTIRRLFQLSYYLLIAIVVLVQVYPIMRIAYLKTFLYMIIAMSLFFLHLEFKQFLSDHWSYITSPYNIVDLIVAGLPLVGSIQLLVNMAMYENTDALGNTRLLSYSIMAVYGHIICELRVFRKICHLTTIIWYILYELFILIVVCAASVAIFAGAIIHMVWAKNHDCVSIDVDGNSVSGPWSCPTRDSDFPRDPLGANIATFFMMVILANMIPLARTFKQAI
ncbi:MAG: hypothetical protein J3Q66DRAFT_385581 [Benniella sp.]|nr:MAG: hypothetical protein J3Q66DRAFT_385581 [Benniella sp.]